SQRSVVFPDSSVILEDAPPPSTAIPNEPEKLNPPRKLAVPPRTSRMAPGSKATAQPAPVVPADYVQPAAYSTAIPNYPVQWRTSPQSPSRTPQQRTLRALRSP